MMEEMNELDLTVLHSNIKKPGAWAIGNETQTAA